MNNLTKSVSIIIRSKNEAKWIGSCLKNVISQNYDKKKIQVIVLDNDSSDGTKEIIKKYKIKFINHKPKKYLPGFALNKAVKFAKNEIVVFLSAHCIPTSKNWLQYLVNSFEKNTAAVYGKQLPFSFSSFKDKRDLFNQFGLERRVQKKDHFFHNANSAVLRKLLKKFPFDDKVLHIEDRIWAKHILKNNYNIVYEPKASVWHFHGLNHSNDEQRSNGVGKILEKHVIRDKSSKANLHHTHNLFIITSHNPKMKNNIFLKKLAIFKKIISKKLPSTKICIVTHSLEVFNKLKKKSFYDCYLLKNKNLRTIKKIKIGLINFEKNNNEIVDVIMIIDVDYILKNATEYKKLLEKFFSEDHDTVIPVKKDYDMYWKKIPSGELIRLDEANKLKKDKKPIYKSFSQFLTIISPELVFKEKRLGNNIGCIVIK
jgi:rhamnosyltransferase